MVAGRGNDTQGGTRGGRGRGEATRQFRWVQGVPPPERKSLEEVEKAAKKANAAKRKAAAEAKKSPAGVQTEVQDGAHQVSADAKSGQAAETAENESGLNESGRAPVRGANVEESQTEGRVSDSSSSVQGVRPKASSEVQAKALPFVPEEKVAPPVPEEKPVEPAQDSSSLEEKSQRDPKASTELVQTETHPESRADRLDDQVAKAYTASQVVR